MAVTLFALLLCLFFCPEMVITLVNHREKIRHQRDDARERLNEAMLEVLDLREQVNSLRLLLNQETPPTPEEIEETYRRLGVHG
jgi:hypothetical protein